MHIALRDLGLDESVKVDGNIIYTALHIPKDILSLEAKKTTYNNFKESMTSYIQNDIQSYLNDFVSGIASSLLFGETQNILVGTYDHLPVMQFLEKERYEAISARAKALTDLLAVGIPEKDALDLCGFNKNLKLEDVEPEQQTGAGGQTGGAPSKPKPKPAKGSVEEEILFTAN